MESKLIIDQFLQKYNHAVASRAQEMRLPISEVGSLVAALSHVMNESLEKNNKIIELQEKHIDSAPSSSTPSLDGVNLDGGKF